MDVYTFWTIYKNSKEIIIAENIDNFFELIASIQVHLCSKFHNFMESCFWKKKKKKRTKRIYILDDLYKIIFKGNYYYWQFIWINRNSNANIQFCLKFHDFMESCFWKKKKKKRTKRYT